MAKKKDKKELEKIEKVGRFEGDIIDKIYVVLGVIIFFCLFSLLTLYITKKNSDNENANQNISEEAVIGYDDIVIGRSLSMDDKEYLVIYYDKSDEEIASTYSSLISEYKAKEDHLTIYRVDMGSSFNKSYVTDGDSNKNPESLKDMAINGPTLIKVTDGAVVEYIEGEEEITEFLK